MLNFLKNNFFTNPNKKILNTYTLLLNKINSLEDNIKLLTDLQIRNKTNELKEKLKSGKTLDNILPEAFALVRDLRENYQIFCSIVVYPVIPKGLILLRLIPTSSHNEDDINETLDAFASIREKLESGIYKRAPEGVGKSID